MLKLYKSMVLFVNAVHWIKTCCYCLYISVDCLCISSGLKLKSDQLYNAPCHISFPSLTKIHHLSCRGHWCISRVKFINFPLFFLNVGIFFCLFPHLIPSQFVMSWFHVFCYGVISFYISEICNVLFFFISYSL